MIIQTQSVQLGLRGAGEKQMQDKCGKERVEGLRRCWGHKTLSRHLGTVNLKRKNILEGSRRVWCVLEHQLLFFSIYCLFKYIFSVTNSFRYFYCVSSRIYNHLRTGTVSRVHLVSLWSAAMPQKLPGEGRCSFMLWALNGWWVCCVRCCHQQGIF